MTCFLPMIPFIHCHIYLDNCPCSNREHSPTIAIINLVSSCRPTDCCLARILELVLLNCFALPHHSALPPVKFESSVLSDGLCFIRCAWVVGVQVWVFWVEIVLFIYLIIFGCTFWFGCNPTNAHSLSFQLLITKGGGSPLPVCSVSPGFLVSLHWVCLPGVTGVTFI